MAFDQSSEVDDAKLLSLYAKGDLDAARALTERLSPRLLRFAQRLVGDHAEAEDIVQDAMMRLWKIAPDWREGDAQVSTWAYRVVRNLSIDLLRKRRGVGLDEIAEPPDDRPSVEAQLIAHDRMSALNAALDLLPQRQKDAVILRHIEGLTNPQIAAILEISVEAVESLTARGKRMLAKHLAGRKEELGL